MKKCGNYQYLNGDYLDHRKNNLVTRGLLKSYSTSNL